MKYKKYPKYKDSGVEWIGEIPEEWEVKKLKFLGEAIIGLTYNPSEIVDSQNGTLVLRASNIQNSSLSMKDCVFVDKKIPQKLRIKKDDILICARNGSKHLVGKNILLDENLIDSTFGAFMTIFRSEYANFISKILNSQIFKSQTGLYSTTTINQLTTSILNNIVVAFTKNEIERNQIVDFLEKQTTQFDELIAKSKTQIILLEEKKQATINQAVTKGLDPSARMKDSGVEWIGDIPEGWEVRSVRYLLNAGKSGIRIGPFGSSLKLDMMKDSGFKIYGQENVIYDDFSIGHRFIDEKKFLEMKNYEIIPNDIVITMMGTTGKSKTVPENMQQGIMDSHLVRMRTNQKICHPKLFSLILNDASYVQSQLTKLSNGSIMQGLNSQIIKSVKIILSPLNEQEKIFDFVQRKKVQFDKLIAKSQEQITLLEEKRQTLITATVTGKIDVRMLTT